MKGKKLKYGTSLLLTFASHVRLLNAFLFIYHELRSIHLVLIGYLFHCIFALIIFSNWFSDAWSPQNKPKWSAIDKIIINMIHEKTVAIREIKFQQICTIFCDMIRKKNTVITALICDTFYLFDDDYITKYICIKCLTFCTERTLRRLDCSLFIGTR